ncbi:MAG: VTT domain-containing protein [Desulfopila sp.]
MIKHKRILLLVGIAVLVVLFFTTGLHRHLSLESVKAQQADFQESYHQHPVAVIAAFVAVYIPVVALNLPGALVLGLAAGALFGTLTGTIIISFASSIGASLACLLSRYLLRDYVHRRFGEKLKKVNDGIQAEGAFYLFALRLMPVIPFFVINLVTGLTSIRLWTFYWVSQLGMLPGTVIFVNAGNQLGRIESIGGILSPGLILSLALLGIFPLLIRRLLQLYRRRWHEDSGSADFSTAVDGKIPPSVETYLRDIRERCTECSACTKACRFLSHYGTPKAIATEFDFSAPYQQAIAYECSLCGMCTAVCPENLDPSGLFLEIRRQYVDEGQLDESKYGAILGYEKRGTSSLFSWYGLPEGCDTVFFPGCTLPGTRPEVTMNMFQDLRKTIPALGIVLDCCAKPSHDLGRQTHFNTMFGELTKYLSGHGVKRVLVACPNCYKIFRQYANGLAVTTVYETIHASGFKAKTQNDGTEISVHDPCALRYKPQVHQAVRGLLSELGMTVMEMKHAGRRTICCGEGGMVGFVKPSLAHGWASLREREVAGRTMVAYCAGCTGFLGRVAPTIHIADLLYRPDSRLDGNPKVARPPFTYLNRLLLKHRLKRKIKPKVQRTR